jgi:hypothetical protein
MASLGKWSRCCILGFWGRGRLIWSLGNWSWALILDIILLGGEEFDAARGRQEGTATHPKLKQISHYP